MKIIVTGGAGFIGTNLIKRLLTDNHRVVSLDNYSTGKKENEQEGCRYFDVDITKVKDYSFFMDKANVIFHLAALARIQPSLQNPIETIENNVNGTLNILEYARVNNIKVVYAGSSSFHHGLYKSPYAWSKYGGEELCKLYSEVYGLSTVICRFYNVYGPNQLEDGDYATVLGIFEKQYRNQGDLTITGDGEQRRDFTHVDDIVRALVKCSDKTFNADIFELGSGVNYSINEIADMFGGEKKYIAVRRGEYDRTLCDYSKAQLKLNWKPQKNIKDYIKLIIND